MNPFGAALSAFFEGRRGAQLVIRRDDGHEVPLPVKHFFREPPEFSEIERAALDECRGRVLDVGAGTGIHSLYLQKRNLEVTAVDIDPLAVEILRARGVRDVRAADISEFQGGSYDTILLLGHGIGMVQTIHGLERFLARAESWLAPGGHVLLDSVDVRSTEDPVHLAYHEANRRAGRYIGEIRVEFEFEGARGPLCGWLHVDAETLAERAGAAGLDCAVLCRMEGGEYLARLGRRKPQ